MKKLSILLGVLVFALSFNLASNSFASEGDQVKGSHMEKEKAGVAIGGYCPVCITSGKYVKGRSKFSTEYKGKIYRFLGLDQQKMFIGNPEAYLADLEEKYKKLKANPKGSKKGSGTEKESGTYKGSN